MSTLRPTLALAATLLLVPVAPAAVRAQGPAVDMGASPGYGVGVAPGYERYAFAEPDAVGIRSLALFTLPYGARLVFPRFRIDVGGAYARGTLVRASGPSVTLEGLTDTSVRLSAPFAGNRLTLSAAAVLPTGESRQTLEEAEVAGAVAADLLPFRISNWGSGGGVDASATLAVPLSALALTARLGFQSAQEFEPIEEQEFSYRPGNQLYGDVAVEGRVGAAGKARLHLTVQRFDDDAFDGRNLFRSGDRVQLVGSYAFAAGADASAVAYAGVLHRSRGTYLTGGQTAPAQDLILAGGTLRLPTAGFLLLPGVDVRVFRSADGVGQGYTAGLGTAAEVPLGAGGAVLVPTVRGRFGKVLVRQGSETRVTGFEVGAGLRFGGPRP